jgi:hypothetical protein
VSTVGQFDDFRTRPSSQRLLNLRQEVLALVRRAETQRLALAAFDEPLEVLLARLAEECLPQAASDPTAPEAHGR